MEMQIAAMSMNMAQSRVQEAVSVSMLSKAMDQQEVQMDALLEAMPPPPSGHLLDVRA